LRYAARRFSEILSEMKIEIVDMAGHAYDPGMVPEVVDVRIDSGLDEGLSVIDETLSPTVMWQGQVIAAGQISIRRWHAIMQGATEDASEPHN
jgi:hypothetical protein